MQIEEVAITDLKGFPDNPNQMTAYQKSMLRKSLEHFGMVDPVIINHDGTIIGGHHRVEQCAALGMDQVPCVRLSLDDADARLLNLGLNQHRGAFDMPKLAASLDVLKKFGADIEIAGFDSKASKSQSSLAADVVPEPPAEPITKPGDLWVLGEHRLLCGDATRAAEVQRLMNGQKASLTFTSPPYNAGDNALGGNKNRTDSKYIGGSDDRPLTEYLRLLVDFTNQALANSLAVAVNIQSLAGNKMAVLDWIHSFKDHFVDRMIWFKGQGQPAMAANVMNSRFEDIWILSPEKNPSRAIPTGRFHSTVSNVYEGRGASGENVAPSIHAATMPLHLATHILSSLDGTGGIIYEPFCGTGTTLIAAEQLGRRCYGLEIEPRYCDVIVKRWESCTGKKATRA